MNKERYAECILFLRKYLNTNFAKDPEFNDLTLAEAVRKMQRESNQDDSHDWIHKNQLHFFWGMQMRNLMRENGFSEKEIDIDNLDDIYIECINEAVKI